MFSAIKSLIVGSDSSSSNNSNNSTQSNNSLRENKPLKSDTPINNISNSSKNKKRTIIKGEKNDFDFSEEYEDEPKQISTSENSISNNDENITYNSIIKLDDLDFWRMAHCVYPKNSLININSMNYVPFIKIKKINEGLFSYIGLGTENIKEIKYLAGLDEHFIYMINLNKEENKDDNDGMKTIGNHYDLHHITNIEISMDENYKNKILVIILFVLDNDIDNYISKIKKFYFEKPNALKFLKLLKIYLNTYKIKISYKDNVFKNINFNKEDEEEEKEKEKENNKEIKEEDKKEEKEKLIKEEEKEEKDENKENEEEIFTSDKVEEKEKNNEDKKEENIKDNEEEKNI